MLEVHPEPCKARSDGYQQLDFAEFSKFMEEINK
jgi:3-deoxy-D-arabino-heptulosonate 7-phosphate (DAHP) synthase